LLKEITLEDTIPIALGAGVLGTGGGGSTYIARIRLEQTIKKYGPCTVIAADDLTDDALVCSVGGMGAPTISIEKLENGQEFVNAVRAIENHLGKKMEAVVIGEIGGGNALDPITSAIKLGLPIVDGDAMGRAFPELQMDTFMIAGVSPAPFALGDAHGNVVIFPNIDSATRAEHYGRALTIQMGGSSALVMPVLNGKELKSAIIRGTLSLTHSIGHRILDARSKNEDPTEAAAKICHGQVAFRGKITDVERRDEAGFNKGKITFASLSDSSDILEIEFQNEFLIARRNNQLICTVPDLISLLEIESGDPIGTEALRYGLRVAVLTMPAAKELKTAQALAVVGPRAFGYDINFQPAAGDLIEG
jgi:uncharacterized protein